MKFLVMVVSALIAMAIVVPIAMLILKIIHLVAGC